MTLPENNKKCVLYISYDGILEPLCRSQILSYLKALSSEYRIHLISFEKRKDLSDLTKKNQLHKEIEEADNPEERRRELEELLAKRSSPFPRAENFSVHELIDPKETRPKLISWIELAVKSQIALKEPYRTTMLP